MKKIIMILLFMTNANADVSLITPSEGWYVHSLSPKKDWLGVHLKNAEKKIEKQLKVNLKTFESSEVSKEQFDMDFKTLVGQKPNVSYVLNKCLSIDLEYLSKDAICESLSLKVDEKEYEFKRHEWSNAFYKWETFISPVLWGDYVIFRNYLPTHKSEDTEKKYKEKINGITVLDTKEQKGVNDLSGGPKFGGAFITTLVTDEENSILWVGSNFGIYGLDKKLKEVVSCGFLEGNKALKIKEFRFVCGAGDYIYDSKYYQLQNIIEKSENLKKGIKPPEDSMKSYHIRSTKEANEKRKKIGLPLLPIDE